MQYRDEGFLPEALLNYLARLGWSHGDQEIFSMEEMIRLFDVTNVHTSAAAFNPEKLLWLNQHYIKTADPRHVAHHLSHHLGKLGIDPTTGPDLIEVVKAQRERAKTLAEMAVASTFFYKAVEAYEPKDAASHLKPEAREPLTALRERLADLPQWSTEAIHAVVNDLAEARGLKLGKIAQPLRVAVAGRAVSPPIDITLALLGREKTLQCLDRALAHIRLAHPV
jgi:glutamyl-tRNA synthetase